jgi:AcrR family transcriptional regulator
MDESATGLRERRVAATARALNVTARRWTARRGLGGFTVEELCDEVGVSRRTFFNYYGSKEDAALGVSVRDDHAGAEEQFVRGGGGGTADLSPTLVADLSELLMSRWELMDLTRDDAQDLYAAFQQEPRLLPRVLEMTRAQELGDIALVERREQLPAGDLRAAAAVHLLGAVLRASVEASLDTGTDRSFRDEFARRLAAARAVFSAGPPPTERIS